MSNDNKAFVRFMKKIFDESEKKGLEGKEFLEYVLKKLDEYSESGKLTDEDKGLYEFTRNAVKILMEHEGGILTYLFEELEKRMGEEAEEEEWEEEEEDWEEDDEEVESPVGIEINGAMTLEELVEKIAKDDEDKECK